MNKRSHLIPTKTIDHTHQGIKKYFIRHSLSPRIKLTQNPQISTPNK